MSGLQGWPQVILVVLATIALAWSTALAQPPAPPAAPPAPGSQETPPGVEPPPPQPPPPALPPTVVPIPLLTPPAAERGPAIVPVDPSVPAPPSPTIPSGLPFPLPRLEAVVQRAGPTFEIHPFLTLSEEYTDNFRLSATGRENNLRSSLAPGLSLIIRGAKTSSTISGSLALTHDTATDEIRVVTTGVLGGELSYEFTPRLRMTVSDFLARSDEPALADRLGLRRERRSFTTNTLALTADWLIGPVATREYYRWTTFFAEETRMAHALGASATVALLPLTTFSAGYEHLRSEAPDVVGHELTGSIGRTLGSYASVGVSGAYALRSSDDNVRQTGNDFTRWSTSLFGAYGVPGRWSLSASVGYTQVAPDTGRSFSGFTTASALSVFFARAVLSFGVEQGFSETFATGENFGVVKTRGAHAAVSYPFTPGINGEARVFYRQNEFTGIAGGPADTTEENLGGSLGVSIQLLRWLTGAFEYAHTTISASARGGAITENRVRLSLTASF